jgi:hypothetical protein
VALWVQLVRVLVIAQKTPNIAILSGQVKRIGGVQLRSIVIQVVMLVRLKTTVGQIKFLMCFIPTTTNAYSIVVKQLMS